MPPACTPTGCGRRSSRTDVDPVAATRPVSRLGGDRFALRLDEQERRILGARIERPREAVGGRGASAGHGGFGWAGPSGDPAAPVGRLSPPAFPDDADA